MTDALMKQVALYETEYRQNYALMADILEMIFKSETKKMGLVALVGVRTKETTSFAEKAFLKMEKYRGNPLAMMTDLCGGRVIVESKDKIKPVVDFIRKNFEIDEKNSEDKAKTIKAQEFGYQSVHFIVSFRKKVQYPGVEAIPKQFFARREATEAISGGAPAGPIYKAEIQVRTLLQHAWAQLVHDNLYKTEMKKKPRLLEREAARVAALLEDADYSFVRLLEQVDFYRSCYGAYRKPEEIKKEIELLDAVRQHDKEKSEKLAHKLARLFVVSEEWGRVKEALLPFGDSGTAAVHRDLGWALWKLGDKVEGRGHLERSTELDNRDADSWCTLGDTYREERDQRQALTCYENAFNAAPDYPRALRSYIECEINENKNFSFLTLLRPNLEAAIRSSQQRAECDMHLPWAYYDIGLFHLLAGETQKSLISIAKGVQLSVTETPLRETVRILTEMQHAALAKHDDRFAKPLQCVRWLLLVAMVAKANALAGQGKDPAKALTAVTDYLEHGDKILDGRRSLATPRDEADPPLFDPARPIVIVAGGCDMAEQEKINDYRPLIHNSFFGWSGDIISGGTTAGIAGIIGDLPNQDGHICKLAYLPDSLPRKDSQHPDYKIIRATGHKDDYSLLDPIQMWIDLLSSGIEPDSVRLLGINGGDIAAFEFRLALTLGAKVGILHNSGREASLIAVDPDWLESPGLLLLPNDQETITAFIQPAPASAMIDNTARITMARHGHEEYRRNQQNRFLRQHPTSVPWEELDETFVNANLAQVDHIEMKIRRINLAIRQVKGRPPHLYEFSKDQLSVLARMEHGRWNVERMLDGWQYGPIRDDDKKIHDCLVDWEKLDPKVQGYDFDAIRNMPGQLAEVEYEIYDPSLDA